MISSDNLIVIKISVAVQFIAKVFRQTKREPWWFRLWTIWGLIVTAIVLSIDRSLASSLVWFVGGLLFALFGQAGFDRLIYAMSPEAMPLGDDRFEEYMNLEHGRLVWRADDTLRNADPRRKPWEMYLPAIVVMSAFHGLLFGPIVGAVCPAIEETTLSASACAAWGLIAGPLFIGLNCAWLMPIVFFWVFRGPSLDPARSVIRESADIAGNCGHDEVIAPHLLLAIFEHPSGAAAKLLDPQGELVARSAKYLQLQLAESTGMDDQFNTTRDLSAVLGYAIDEAKMLRHKSVEPAHLLLAVLKACPEETTDVLAKAGFREEELRSRIVECLKR